MTCGAAGPTTEPAPPVGATLQQVLDHCVARGHRLVADHERPDRLHLLPLGPESRVVAVVDPSRSWLEFGAGAWPLVHLLGLAGVWSRGTHDTAGARITTAAMATQAMLLFDAYGKERLHRP